MLRSPSFSFIPHPEYPATCDRFVMDGRVDEGSLANLYAGDARHVSVADANMANRLFDMSCNELATHFRGLMLPVQGSPPVMHVYFNWFTYLKKPQPSIEFDVPLDLRNWTNPWTPVEFIDTLSDVAKTFPDSEISVSESAYFHDTPGTIRFPLFNQHLPARKILDSRLPAVLSLLEAANSRLTSYPTMRSISRTFAFAAGVSIPAQRYLLYFTQFLADLGIEATSELKQNSGSVLFSVKPTSKAVALERIAEALRVYLHLPTIPEFLEASIAFANPAVVDLRRTVEDLQAQLTAVQTDLKVRDHSRQQRRRKAGAKAESEEPLIGRFLSIKPYEGKWYKINLPLLLRSLKREWRGQQPRNENPLTKGDSPKRRYSR